MPDTQTLLIGGAIVVGGMLLLGGDAIKNTTSGIVEGVAEGLFEGLEGIVTGTIDAVEEAFDFSTVPTVRDQEVFAGRMMIKFIHGDAVLDHLAAAPRISGNQQFTRAGDAYIFTRADEWFGWLGWRALRNGLQLEYRVEESGWPAGRPAWYQPPTSTVVEASKQNIEMNDFEFTPRFLNPWMGLDDDPLRAYPPWSRKRPITDLMKICQVAACFDLEVLNAVSGPSWDYEWPAVPQVTRYNAYLNAFHKWAPKYFGSHSPRDYGVMMMMLHAWEDAVVQNKDTPYTYVGATSPLMVRALANLEDPLFLQEWAATRLGNLYLRRSHALDADSTFTFPLIYNGQPHVASLVMGHKLNPANYPMDGFQTVRDRLYSLDQTNFWGPEGPKTPTLISLILQLKLALFHRLNDQELAYLAAIRAPPATPSPPV